MAGPAASVLLPSGDVDARAAARRAMASCGDESTGSDFVLEGRPFVMMVTSRYLDDVPDLADELPQLLGWTPEATVTFGAMCNGARDHRLLARLCLALCEDAAGIVDFGGTLPVGPKLDPSRRAEAVRIPNPSGLTGTLYAAAYEVIDGSFGTRHFGDARLLRAWLAHPDFRMVK